MKNWSNIGGDEDNGDKMNSNNNIIVKHWLNNKFACLEDGGYCGHDIQNNIDIYVFKIIGVKIQSSFKESNIYIRGEHTCWFNINGCLIYADEDELQDYVEIRAREKLLKTETYIININPSQEF